MRKLFILKNYLFHEKEHHDIHDMMLYITDSFKEELLSSENCKELPFNNFHAFIAGKT